MLLSFLSRKPRVTQSLTPQVAPYLTLLLNGIGWSSAFPRLMTNEQLSVALKRAQVLGGARFTNIGDISCDVEVCLLDLSMRP